MYNGLLDKSRSPTEKIHDKNTNTEFLQNLVFFYLFFSNSNRSVFVRSLVSFFLNFGHTHSSTPTPKTLFQEEKGVRVITL